MTSLDSFLLSKPEYHSSFCKNPFNLVESSQIEITNKKNLDLPFAPINLPATTNSLPYTKFNSSAIKLAKQIALDPILAFDSRV